MAMRLDETWYLAYCNSIIPLEGCRRCLHLLNDVFVGASFQDIQYLSAFVQLWIIHLCMQILSRPQTQRTNRPPSTCLWLWRKTREVSCFWRLRSVSSWWARSEVLARSWQGQHQYLARKKPRTVPLLGWMECRPGLGNSRSVGQVWIWL